MIIAKADAQEFTALLRDDPASDDLPPPPFEPEENHIQLNFVDDSGFSAPGGEPPPPEFTPYQAEYFQASSGDIVTHDRHLNEDGEALYRFLLSQATTPPTYRLHCRGDHTEQRTRWVTHRNSHGRTETRPEHYTESITDFDFYIDIGQNIVMGPVHWSIADSEPTYRGLMIRQVDVVDGRRKATKEEKKQFDAWKTQRSAMGLAPWVGSEFWFSGRGEDSVMKSSRTLRQWADDYCESKKYLKEFVYEKVIHGWNIANLKEAVHSTIASSLYPGRIRVDFEVSSSKVYIRPDNQLSRMLSNRWLKFLFIIFLIYPFIWLFKRYASHGGGRWQVCGGAYALKHWEAVRSPDGPHQEPRQTATGSVPESTGSTLTPRLIETHAGMSTLIGLREGEWFKEWEGTIRRAVQNRYQSNSPLYQPDVVTVDAARRLDGYSS